MKLTFRGWLFIVWIEFTSLFSHTVPTQSQEHIVTASMLLSPPLTTHNAVISEMIQANVNRSNGGFSTLSVTIKISLRVHGVRKMSSVIKSEQRLKFEFCPIVLRIKEKWGRKMYSFTLTTQVSFKKKTGKNALYLSFPLCHHYLSCCMYYAWVRFFFSESLAVYSSGSQMCRRTDRWQRDDETLAR